MRIISSGSWGALGNASNVFSAGGVHRGRGHSIVMISAHHKLQQFLPNSWFWIKSQNIHSAEETKPNPISEPSCSKLLWNFKSWRISVFLLWRNVLSACFLELLIKICHAVINSFKNVTGSNPHQGRGSRQLCLAVDFWLRKGRGAQGEQLCELQCSEPQQGCAGHFWAPASHKLLLPPRVCSRLTLSWTCSDNAPDSPLFIYFYHCKWK